VEFLLELDCRRFIYFTYRSFLWSEDCSLVAPPVEFKCVVWSLEGLLEVCCERLVLESVFGYLILFL